jgi:FkbM family methyltransferase
MQINENGRPFNHYGLRYRLIGWISRTMFGNITYTVRRGLLKGLKRHGGLGWIPAVGVDATETPEHRFLRGLDLSGKVVFDIGAFEGLITLFFARTARWVVCYEPNPRNYARLCENLALNQISNVTVRKCGLGEQAGTASMAWDPAMPGGATLAYGTSDTINRQRNAKHAEIRITTLERDRAEEHLPEPDLIKVDVEGLELAVLKGADCLLKTKHPALYLEMHGETMQEKCVNVRAIVDYLRTIGYDHILHVESTIKITEGNCERALQGHLYATRSTDMG